MKSAIASLFLLSFFLLGCSEEDIFEEDSMGPEPVVDTSALEQNPEENLVPLLQNE